MHTVGTTGTYDLVGKDGTLTPLNRSDNPLPFLWKDEAEVGLRDMASEVERVPGIGFTTGANPKKPSHILSAPGKFGPQIQKVK